MERTYPHRYPIRPADVEFIRDRYYKALHEVERIEAGGTSPSWGWIDYQRGVLEGMQAFALALGYWGGVGELVTSNGERKPGH